MISELRNLFLEILNTEEEFADHYEELLQKISDPKVKSVIAKIRDDELRHAKNAREILRILEE
jgi:rubrerythrin